MEFPRHRQALAQKVGTVGVQAGRNVNWSGQLWDLKTLQDVYVPRCNKKYGGVLVGTQFAVCVRYGFSIYRTS